MSPTLSHTIIPLAASLIMALLVYAGLKDLKIISFGKSSESRLGEFAERDKRGMTDRVGEALLDRLGLNTKTWENYLHWSQIGGYYKNSTVGSFIGRAALYGMLGFVTGFLLSGFSFITIGVTAIAVWLPLIQLHDKAADVREATRRSLPEAAAFVAGEMSAGISSDAALGRVEVLSGPLARIIADASDKARTSGRLLLSQAGVRGIFREYAEELQMQELVSFASQVDMVSERGAEGPKLMSDVARMLARNYRTEINRAAAGLDMKMLVPMSIFFLVPMLASMLVPLFISIMTTFM